MKAPQRKMIFCEPCSYKMIIESDSNLNLSEIPTSPIPGGVPELDPKTGKAKIKNSTPQAKKYKCPRCGRGASVKELQPAYASALKKIDEQKEQERIALDRKQRLEDGKPIEKKTDFLGK
jgi:hypothetical protein